MKKEQLTQQIIKKLQNFSEANLQQVNQYISMLISQGNEGITAQPKPYKLPDEDENPYILEDAKEEYKTKYNRSLEALSRKLKAINNNLLLKAVQRFLHTIEIKQFRSSLRGKAQQQGFNSEDDILASFS